MRSSKAIFGAAPSVENQKASSGNQKAIAEGRPAELAQVLGKLEAIQMAWLEEYKDNQ